MQLQEQLSLKPSVAKKLADKIKVWRLIELKTWSLASSAGWRMPNHDLVIMQALEIELETTRAASRVLELERKVQVRQHFSLHP